MMIRGTSVIVKPSAPYHAGQKGYFMKILSDGRYMLTREPCTWMDSWFGGYWAFAVEPQFVQECPKDFKPPLIYIS